MLSAWAKLEVSFLSEIYATSGTGLEVNAQKKKINALNFSQV